MEQEEYRREGIEVAVIDYENNEPTLQCLIGRIGSLLSTVDEECKMPRASDQSLTTNMRKLEAHPSGCLKVSKSDRALEFSVNHYAGRVMYSSEGFLEKNRDKVSADLTQLIRHSEEMFISSLFRANHRATGSFAIDNSRGEKRHTTSTNPAK